MDDQQKVQDLQRVLDILQRDIASQQESLKMISRICIDKKVQRLLYAVVCSQNDSIFKIIEHYQQERRKK